MAFTNGQGGSVTVGSSTLVVESWSLTESCEALDCTTTGSGGWADNIAGVKEWECSLKTFYDSTTNYHGGGFTLTTGTAVTLTLPIAGTGDSYTGSARVTKYMIDHAAKGIVKIDFDAKGNSTLTRAS